MSKEISFLKGQKPIPLEGPANLMETLRNSGIPVASSCGGKGICGKCAVNLESGAENLSPETDLETFYRSKNPQFKKTQRLSCQAEVKGSIKIDTPYW